MANEAILVYETEPAIPINVANANALEKGAVLELADNFVGVISHGANEVFGGITKYEKIALDGLTKMGVYFGGVFKMVVGTNGVTVGLPVKLDDAVNTVTDTAANDSDLGYVLGRALETATAGQTALIWVGKGSM